MFGENNEFSVQERILLHLSRYNGFREHYLNPESVTQEGIAGAVGIARNHVPRAINGLKNRKFVDELKGRVKGSDRRKKVYFLSEEGIRNVNLIKEKMRVLETFLTDVPDTPGFVGREMELREIKKALGGKTVVITGAEGMGKTCLASQIAKDASKDLPVLWYSVQENDSLHQFLRALSELLNRSGNGLLGYRLGAASALDEKEMMKLIAGSLTECMIVLDDFHNAGADLKHFIGAIIGDIGCFNGLRLLIVSEEDFGTSKKLLTVKLGPLDDQSVRSILESRGISDLDGACEIAAANPLFLNIIGANKGKHAGIGDFLEDEFNGMSGEEKRAMWALSMHPHPVGLELLSAVGDTDYQVLVNLAEKGLVQEFGNRTFDTHRLLKEFFISKIAPAEKKRMHLRAAAKLAENEDSISWLEAQNHLLKAGARDECAKAVALNGVRIIRKGLRREVEAIIAELDQGELDGVRRAEVLLLSGYVSKLKGEWDRALGDYQKALEIFEKNKLPGKKADALAKIGRVYLEQGKFDNAKEYFDRGLGYLGKGPDIVRARILDELATIHLRKREIEEARAKAEEAMEEARNLGDCEMEAMIHNTMGNLRMTQGSLSEAKGHYENSLDGLKDTDEQMAVVLLNNLAIIEFKTGSVEKAIELWEQAAGKAEAMKSLNVMLTFSNLGSIYFSLGNWDRAAECCAKALEISEMVGKGNITAASRSTLGHIALRRGEGDWMEHYVKALELRTGLEDRSGMASSHNDMADGFIAGKKWDEAEIHAQSALALAKEKGDSEQTARSLLALGDIHAGKNEYPKAKEYLKMAIMKSREMKNSEFIGRTYRSIGLVSAQEGEEFVAERYLKESVEMLEKEMRPLLLAQSLKDYADILERSGLGEPADYYKRSKEIFETLGIKERDLASG